MLKGLLTSCLAVAVVATCTSVSTAQYGQGGHFGSRVANAFNNHTANLYGGANCGREISNHQAQALWAGYCTDNCTISTGCGGGCGFGGGCGVANSCGTNDCGNVCDDGCGSGFGGGCFAKLRGLFSGRGCGNGCGGNCFGFPGGAGGCGCDTGCGGSVDACYGGGAVLGRIRHRGCGCGLFSGVGSRIGNGCGGCGLFSGGLHGRLLGGFYGRHGADSCCETQFTGAVNGHSTNGCGCSGMVHGASPAVMPHQGMQVQPQPMQGRAIDAQPMQREPLKRESLETLPSDGSQLRENPAGADENNLTSW